MLDIPLGRNIIQTFVSIWLQDPMEQLAPSVFRHVRKLPKFRLELGEKE